MPSPRIVAIVDDDEDVRTSLRMLVESIGHEAALFHSPADFADWKRPPSLGCVICDVRTGGGGGIQLARRLRDGSGVPVILVTGLVTAEIEARAAEAGAHRVFGKPFDSMVLIDELDAILGTATGYVSSETGV